MILDIEIDTEELSLYLAVTNTSEELEKLGFSQITHRRIHKRDQRLEIITEEILNRKTETVSRFHKPEREPAKEESRKMVAVVIEVIPFLLLYGSESSVLLHIIDGLSQ